MTQQIINLGTADKGNGDVLRTAFGKVNANFAELYNQIATSVVVGATAPTAPGAGDLWWNSESGRMYVYYGSAWVDASPVDGAGISSTNELVNGGNTVSLESDGKLTLPNGAKITPIAFAGIDLEVGTKIWNFGTDGGLTLPGYLTSQTGLPLNLSASDGSTATLGIWSGDNLFVVNDTAAIVQTNGDKFWTFGTDGLLTFPDDTVQTTAWTGSVSSLVNGAKTVTLNTGGALTANLDSALGVQTSQTLTNNNIITADSEFFPTPGYVGDGVDSFIPVWSQRNTQQIEVNLFVYGGTPTYTMLTSLPLGTEVIVTYSQMGPQTFTTVLSQQFTDQDQVDVFDRLRLSGRIDGTLPVGAVTIISINFTHYSTQLNAWTFGAYGALTLPDASVIASYKPVTVIAAPTGVQSITDSASAAPLMFIDTVDTATAFANGVFTVPYTGYYQFNVNVYFTSNVTITDGFLFIADTTNEGLDTLDTLYYGPHTGRIINGSSMLLLTAGHTVRLFFYQLSGGPVDIGSSSRLTIHRVSIS